MTDVPKHMRWFSARHYMQPDRHGNINWSNTSLMQDLIPYVAKNLYCGRSSWLRQRVVSWCILGQDRLGYFRAGYITLGYIRLG